MHLSTSCLTKLSVMKSVLGIIKDIVGNDIQREKEGRAGNL